MLILNFYQENSPNFLYNPTGRIDSRVYSHFNYVRRIYHRENLPQELELANSEQAGAICDFYIVIFIGSTNWKQ